MTWPRRIAAVVLLLFCCLSLGQESADAWKTVFPDAEIPSAVNIDPRANRFLNVVRQHLDLLELLPIRKSPARRVVVLPDELYPFDRPTFLFEEQVLVVGALRGCEVGHEHAYVVVNLHDFAHSVFAANLYAALGLDAASTFADRYDPQAAYANREPQLSKLVPFGDLVTPFAEVFADAYAVLAVDDPSAVSRALHECGHDEARDFARLYEARDWDRGELRPICVPLPNPDPYRSQPGPTAPRFYVFRPNVHEVLSPLRSATWAAYTELRARHAVKPGAVVLEALRCAAITVATRQHDSGMTYRAWFAISKPEYNQAAIAALRQCIESAEMARDSD